MAYELVGFPQPDTSEKPHLKAAFPDVHQERADLYCYFFQLSGRLLREGGRYGIIVSNKWLKAQYGQPSRAFLRTRFQLEALQDFGELPVFEDAAVMPVMLLATRREEGCTEPLRFAQIPRLPHTDAELEALDAEHGHAVPPAQLGDDAWLLVDAARGAAFAERKRKGIPLREYLGGTPICWGIKTGFNEAFWLSQTQRDALVAANPEAKAILKPLVIGDEVRRWALRQDEPHFLIYTSKGRYSEAEFRDRFPAVARHLEPFRSLTRNGKTVGLDHRATRQAWFELQQAQEAYEPFFASEKLVWPDMAMNPRWALDSGSFAANTIYFTPGRDLFLLGALNSQRIWQSLGSLSSSLGNPGDGGRLRLFGNTLESLLIPQPSQKVAHLAEHLLSRAATLEHHRRAFLRFLRQDAPWQLATAGEKLEAFWELDEAAVLAEALKRRNRKLKEPSLGEREFLKRAWREAREPILELRSALATLETELDAAVDAAWEA